MLEQLHKEQFIIIKQLRELVELIGFETRNKYGIFGSDGNQIGFAAEQQKGFVGVLLRQIVGHWRSFDIHIFDNNRMEQMVAHHPFRFYFQRLDVRNPGGELLGSVEKKFSILSKKFQVLDKHGKLSSDVQSGLFKIWTFPFTRDGKEIARISKQWGGGLKEVFLDSDTFKLEFIDDSLDREERSVLLSAAILIDLLYFENNQGGGLGLGDLLPG